MGDRDVSTEAAGSSQGLGKKIQSWYQGVPQNHSKEKHKRVDEMAQWTEGLPEFHPWHPRLSVVSSPPHVCCGMYVLCTGTHTNKSIQGPNHERPSRVRTLEEKRTPTVKA